MVKSYVKVKEVCPIWQAPPVSTIFHAQPPLLTRTCMWHFSKFTSHLCNHVTKGRCIVTVCTPWRYCTLRTAAPARVPPTLLELPGAVADTDTPPRSRNQGSWRQQPANQGPPGPRLDQWEARPGSCDPGWSWRHLAPNQWQGRPEHYGTGEDGESLEQRDQQQLLIRATNCGGSFGI